MAAAEQPTGSARSSVRAAAEQPTGSLTPSVMATAEQQQEVLEVATTASELRELLTQGGLAARELRGFRDEHLDNLLSKGLSTLELLATADEAVLTEPPLLPLTLRRALLAKFNPDALIASTGKRGREADLEGDDEAGPSKKPRTGLQEQDWSQHWVTYLEKPLPQLPNTQADVEAVLFPAQPDIRIPVNPVYYHMAKTRYPKTAAQLLKQADASLLVARLTSLLDQQWREGYTELHTSVHVVRFIEEVFGSLEEYSSHNVTCNIMLNSTEQSSTASSRTVREKLRPDTTVALNKCTLLLGEDKFSVLADAIEDLKRKRLELTSAHYGPVHFLLAYAAAGKEFQWFWMSSDGKQVLELGRLFNFSKQLDRIELTLSLARAFFLMVVMARSVPQLSRRPTLYSKIPRGPDGHNMSRYLLVLPNRMQKVICNFHTFKEEHKADFDTIVAAYAAANQAAVQSHPNPPFIVTTAWPPKLGRHRYEVYVKPLGYSALCTNEQDVRALACACCKAAQVLHAAGCVHRDFRMANVVQLGPGAYMVIDLETVGKAEAEPLPMSFHLTGWRSDTLSESRRYTTYSDMYQIGLMIDEQLKVATNQPSENALDFVDQLQLKTVSAKDALQHIWFS